MLLILIILPWLWILYGFSRFAFSQSNMHADIALPFLVTITCLVVLMVSAWEKTGPAITPKRNAGAGLPQDPPQAGRVRRSRVRL